MKIDYRITIAIIVSLFIIDHVFLNNDPKVNDVTIVTPEEVGGVEKKLAEAIPDTVYIEVLIPGKNKPQKKQIIVDSTYKAKYDAALKANDSITARNLYLESISINEVSETLIDNKDIKIDGKFKTRGTLLEYSIDYKIKSDTIKYTPQVTYLHPKLTIVYGVKLGLPIQAVNPGQPTIEAVLGFQNKKGNMVTFGITSDKRATVGYYKSFKLIK